MNKEREQDVNEKWHNSVGDVVRESLALDDLINRLVSNVNDCEPYKSQGSIPFDIVMESVAIVMMLQRGAALFRNDFGELLLGMIDIVEKDPKKVAKLKALTRH
jgi:hypothetical protein